MEFLKPLVVLGLMGMILYGAYSVISRGPGRESIEPISPLQPTVALDISTPGPGSQIPEPPGPPATDGPPPTGTLPTPDGGAMPPQPAPVSAGPPPATAVVAPPDGPPLAGPPAAAASLAAAASVPPGQAAAPAAASPSADVTLPADMPLPAAALRGQAALPPLAGPPGLADSSRPPVGSPFATAWTEAHEKLAAGQYAEALSILSAWQDDPGLAEAETRRLDELLGQLAGSVVYSRESHLGPPHEVAPGETLESIAAPLHVPWQLLGKINGVDDPAALVPGEALKTVEGPFDAIVSLSRRRLSLQLRGRYAGSFPIAIGRQVEEKVGQSLAVERIHRGGTGEANAPAELASGGPVVQAAFHAGGAARQILLRDGVLIEAVADPADAPPGATSIVVSAPDLAELVDILVPGSHVFLRP